MIFFNQKMEIFTSVYKRKVVKETNLLSMSQAFKTFNFTSPTHKMLLEKLDWAINWVIDYARYRHLIFRGSYLLQFIGTEKTSSYFHISQTVETFTLIPSRQITAKIIEQARAPCLCSMLPLNYLNPFDASDVQTRIAQRWGLIV